MKRLKIILLILCFNTINASLKGQKDLEDFADSLLLSGQDDFALKEYLRCYFFQKDKSDSDLCLKISLLYRNRLDFDKSLEYADYHYFRSGQNQIEQNRALIEKVKIYMLMADHGSALISASMIREWNSEEKDKKIFYMGCINIMRKDMSNGKNYLLAISYLSKTDKARLDSLLHIIDVYYKKNPDHAMIYSAFLPGLGQAIHGDFKDGAKSFALVGGLGVVFIEIAKSLSFGNAVISVSPWIIRYFVGGMINASKQASRNYRTKIEGSMQEILILIKQSSIDSKH
ncbi:MAG: hypothetical protein WAU01_13845 [Saprospiraceae bacterium]